VDGPVQRQQGLVPGQLHEEVSSAVKDETGVESKEKVTA